jgi:opacity protein-like surface antigen
MKKLLFILFIVVSVPAFSQNLTTLEYSMGFGTGDMGDFIDKPSFRGFTLDYRRLVQPNVGVGFEGGWNVFYAEESYAVYTQENVSLGGRQFRYQNQVPLLFSADYYFHPDETINPFVGLGLGTMYSRRNTDMGQYTLEEDAWHFALRPEVGVIYEVNPEFGFSLTGKYYYGFEAGDLNEPMSYFALNIGFVFK